MLKTIEMIAKILHESSDHMVLITVSGKDHYFKEIAGIDEELVEFDAKGDGNYTYVSTSHIQMITLVHR